MAATPKRRAGNATPSGEGGDASDIRHLIAELSLEALRFVPGDRVEQILRHWLARGGAQEDERSGLDVVTDAVRLASDLALFTPSPSGSTAIDRLLRNCTKPTPEEAAAAEALRRARFRLLRVEAQESEGNFQLRDLASGETLRVLDDAMPSDCVGLAMVARLAPMGDGRYVFAGLATPLDDTGLEVAQGFIRPGSHGLSNAQRCAEAVYRHVVRHGGPEIPGLNRPPGDGPDADGFPIGPEDSDLDALAHAWAELDPGAEPPPDQVQLARGLASAEALVDALVSSAMARDWGRDRLAEAYGQVALLQMETLQLREAAGMSAARLDAAAAAIDRAVAVGELPSRVRALFDTLRLRLMATSPGSRQAHDAELDRLVQRIQALRAKTVEQGCTEQEALAAAEKAAELLDRHGLSLSELDLRRQACEGIGVETGRRRIGPIDDCVPAIAEFFDCRVWAEKAASGALRYIFFGLPGDVEAARYLYGLIELAFETETGRFQAGAIYGETRSGNRRSATNSFQIGLARGIRGKLHELRQAREAVLRGSSGRDLVPIKAAIVEDELAKLGLTLRARSRAAKRYVLTDAYEAGHEAGRRFEYRPGLTSDE
ncbi:MAG TPA: DUF2786 domain-containing protein [Crenalkalicoccus sp.]|nr:DUF2786 domain-containing protein [Crenalkalicoccus sp.]